MESTKQTAMHRKWMLCTVASFLGFFFLVFCMDQGRRQGVLLLATVDSLEEPRPGSLAITGEAVPGVDISGELKTSSHGARAAAASPQPAPEKTAQQSGGVEVVTPQSTFELLSPPKQQTMESSAEEKAIAPPLTSSSPPLPSAAAPVAYQSALAELTTTIQPPSEALPPQSAEESPAPAGSDQEGENKACDIFDGRWVYDPEAYPLYHAPQCPFLTAQVSCQKNGRPDSDYEHWRWQPRGCDIPRFNGRSMLERLRGKRVVIVGDSLNRNQWESLSCLLYSSVRSSRAVVKAQASDFKVFRALDYDCSVEFYWSPFLVKLQVMDTGKKVLKLQKLPGFAKRWRNADVMVFNTGHWWTHRGKMRSWDLYERGGELVEDMDVNAAYETALRTWSRWVDKNVDPARTTVFFRSVSPEHKRENLHWCYNQTYPITNESYVQWFPRPMRDIVEKTIGDMRTPVRYLNITHLSEFRREAHTSVYTVRQMKLLTEEQRRQPGTYADCSHWCLPGLPDTWNVLLYASIIDT